MRTLGWLAILVAVANPAAAQPMNPAEARLFAARNVVVEKVWWDGGALFATELGLHNRNGFGVRDMAVRCDFFAQSGTHVGLLKAVVYDRLAAGERKTTRRIDFGFAPRQGGNASCSVSDLLIE